MDKPNAIARARTDRSANIHIAPGSEQLIDAVPADTEVIVYVRKRQPQHLWAYVSVPSRQNEHGYIRDDFLRVIEDLRLPAHPPALDPGPVNVPRETEIPLPDDGRFWTWVALAVVGTMLAVLFAI